MKKNGIYIALGILSILLLWIISSSVINNSLVLPEIDEVVYSLKDILKDTKTYLIIIDMLFKLIIIISISLLVAFIFAILSYRSLRFENFVKPMFVIIKTIPIIAIIILLLIVFGSRKSPYIMTLLVVLPIMYEGLLGSLKNINQDVIDDIKTLSKINFKVIKDMYFPLTLQFFFITITQSFGIGLKVMIMGEFIAQPNNSIGYILLLERSNLNTSNILAWSIILIAIVLIFEILISSISKRYIKF